MRDHAAKVDTGMDIFEIVGTGGDNAHSFNISTPEQAAKMAGIADGALWVRPSSSCWNSTARMHRSTLAHM